MNPIKGIESILLRILVLVRIRVNPIKGIERFAPVQTPPKKVQVNPIKGIESSAMSTYPKLLCMRIP